MRLSTLALVISIGLTAPFTVASAQNVPSFVPPAAISAQEQEAIDALIAALAAATTPEEAAQILADAVAAMPTLATKTTLALQMQSAAGGAGLSPQRIENVVNRGLSTSTDPTAAGVSYTTVYDTSNLLPGAIDAPVGAPVALFPSLFDFNPVVPVIPEPNPSQAINPIDLVIVVNTGDPGSPT